MVLASLQRAADIATLVGSVGLVIGAVGIIYAVRQTRFAARQTGLAVTAAELSAQTAERARQVAQAQFTLTLDAAFAEHRELRNNLNDPKWRAETSRQRNEVRRYLALFERVGVLMEKGWLTLEQVDQFYAPRFRKLLWKKGVREIVEGDLIAWRDVVKLWARLCEERSSGPEKERFPEPPELGDAEPLRTSTGDEVLTSDETFEPVRTPWLHSRVRLQ
jgi:hypothetical protein